MNGKSRAVIAVSISSFLHLTGFFLILSFFRPKVPTSSENAISLSFPDAFVPAKKRLIHRKQISFVNFSPIHRRSVMPAIFSQHPVIRPAVTRETGVFSIANEPDAQWIKSLRGLSGEEIGAGPAINREMVAHILPAAHTQSAVSSTVRPHGQSISLSGSMLTELAKPHMLGSCLTEDMVLATQVEVPLDKTDSNKIDVIFIISCRGEMRNYFEYAIAVVEREIQKYKETEKDCRVGMIKSRFQRLNRPVHQIEYWPPSSGLDRIVEIARETRNLKTYSSDIFLNAIRYALDRCTFRPEALRKIVAIGNDIPLCGGYSPLSIIELCSKKRVVLDIHGADVRIGSLLARETGGKWFSALENPRDRESLESIHIESREWKIQYTIDSVVEGQFTH